MIEMLKPQKERIYPLSRNEREEVQNFVNDQLRKGYIRPSKSSQTLSVFFVSKKDKSKRIVMDYHSLNEQTIMSQKSNYVTNFIWPYLHQLFDDSHGLNGYRKPSKRPLNQFQSHLKAISIGQDIKQINR